MDFESNTALVQKGAPAPGAPGTTFANFKDPVAGFGLNGARVTAFQASLTKSPEGQDAGIWSHTRGGDSVLELVAREGMEAPGAPGAKFANLESLSVIEGRGVVFTARLARQGGAVTEATDRGCWAMDSDGNLRLIFREGDSINGRLLRSFSLLGAVPGSPGHQRAWATGDATPSLIYRAVYSDGYEAIVTVTVP